MGFVRADEVHDRDPPCGIPVGMLPAARRACRHRSAHRPDGADRRAPRRGPASFPRPLRRLSVRRPLRRRERPADDALARCRLTNASWATRRTAWLASTATTDARVFNLYGGSRRPATDRRHSTSMASTNRCLLEEHAPGVAQYSRCSWRAGAAWSRRDDAPVARADALPCWRCSPAARVRRHSPSRRRFVPATKRQQKPSTTRRKCWASRIDMPAILRKVSIAADW